MIGKAFKIRRKRRGLTYSQVAALAQVGMRKVVTYEKNFLYQTEGGSKKKLDDLNYRWTIEDYENR